MLRFPTLPSRRQRGFTVIEMVITLLIFSILLVAMLALFDQSNKLARAQTNIADMQQSLRISIDEVVRNARASNRGWGFDPNDSVVVTNNTGGNLVAADDDTEILPNTDVLRIRGVITGHLYEVSEGVSQAGGTIRIEETSPTGRFQDIEQLEDDMGDAVALMIVSAVGEVAVVAVTLDSVDLTPGDAFATLEIDFDPSDLAAGFGQLTPSVPNWLTEQRPIAMAGIFEELHYYVRANRVVPGDNTSEARPRLAVAHMTPGDMTAPIEPFLDIADGIIDMQLALGVDDYDTDTDDPPDGIDDAGDGVIVDGKDPASGVNADSDEWFLNDAGDAAIPTYFVDGELFYVRMTILARTQRRDFKYISPAFQEIEDRDYSEADTGLTDAEAFDRAFHRRLLQTVIDLRNI